MLFCLIECLIKKNGFNYICENYFQNNGTYFREQIEEMLKSYDFTCFASYKIINTLDMCLANQDDRNIKDVASDVKEILKAAHL